MGVVAVIVGAAMGPVWGPAIRMAAQARPHAPDRRHQVMRRRRNMIGLFYGGFAINLFIAFIPGRAMWRIFFG